MQGVKNVKTLSLLMLLHPQNKEQGIYSKKGTYQKIYRNS